MLFKEKKSYEGPPRDPLKVRPEMIHEDKETERQHEGCEGKSFVSQKLVGMRSKLLDIQVRLILINTEPS